MSQSCGRDSAWRWEDTGAEGAVGRAEDQAAVLRLLGDVSPSGQGQPGCCRAHSGHSSIHTCRVTPPQPRHHPDGGPLPAKPFCSVLCPSPPPTRPKPSSRLSAVPPLSPQPPSLRPLQTQTRLALTAKLTASPRSALLARPVPPVLHPSHPRKSQQSLLRISLASPHPQTGCPHF